MALYIDNTGMNRPSKSSSEEKRLSVKEGEKWVSACVGVREEEREGKSAFWQDWKNQ